MNMKGTSSDVTETGQSAANTERKAEFMLHNLYAGAKA